MRYISPPPTTIKKKKRMSITIVYDIETSGHGEQSMNSPNHKIIQIAACCLENGLKFERFVDPAIEVHPESSKIHNIYNKDLVGAKGIEVVFIEMLIHFSTYRYTHVHMCAHNGKFDERMLRREVGSILPSNLVFHDTLPLIRKKLPTLSSYSLPYVYLVVTGTGPVGCHRANHDVTMLVEIFKKLDISL